MPDDDGTRLARLEQKVHDLDGQVKLLIPMASSQAEMRSDMRHMGEAMDGIKDDVGALRSALDDRDAQVSAERRQTRVALYSLVGVLGGAIISAIAAVLIAGAPT